MKTEPMLTRVRDELEYLTRKLERNVAAWGEDADANKLLAECVARLQRAESYLMERAERFPKPARPTRPRMMTDRERYEAALIFG